MLYRPVLAKCDNRDIKAKIHPHSGSPKEWLDDILLKPHGLRGVSFDFFVNWKTSRISNEIWLKMLVKGDIEPWPVTNSEVILKEINECEGSENVRALCGFAHKYRFSSHYFLFKESENWQTNPSPIIEVVLDENGLVIKFKTVAVSELKARIQNMSGGPVSIGYKGLIYGLTSLECFLSKTDSAWPGDVDMVLINTELNVYAIIEFKKHTLGSPIENQKLSNYYPKPDGRKYDRLSLLNNYLGVGNIPIAVVYYPTRELISKVKLECIHGQTGSLKTIRSIIIPLPTASDTDSCEAFVKSVIDILKGDAHD